jgi:hypothetical protein
MNCKATKRHVDVEGLNDAFCIDRATVQEHSCRTFWADPSSPRCPNFIFFPAFYLGIRPRLVPGTRIYRGDTSMKLRACCITLSLLFALVCTTPAQTTLPNSGQASIQVPRLIRFSGVAQDETHNPIIGVVSITFSLYKDQQGGSPLWAETQNIQADTVGHYTALLG